MRSTIIQSVPSSNKHYNTDSWLSELPDQWPVGLQDDYERSMADKCDQVAPTMASSILSDPPILSPYPPSMSTRKSRSPSPTGRTLEALLARATPPIIFNRIKQPEPVAALRKLLTKEVHKAIIPRAFESRLRDIEPDLLDGIYDGVFDDEGTYNTGELDALWAHIRKVYDEVNACRVYNKDENAWVSAAWSVLQMVGLHSTSTDLQVNSVQTQSIYPEYLPTLPNSTTLVSKKADLALVFPPNPLQELWLKKYPADTLSHLSDTYTTYVPIVCPLEIKRNGGDSQEAQLQLGIWVAAALWKIQTLQAYRMQEDRPFVTLPYPGWTVIGHQWVLHIVWKDESNAVMVSGDLQSLSMNNYLDIFRLRKTLLILKKWLLETYQPWFYKEVLGIQG